MRPSEHRSQQTEKDSFGREKGSMKTGIQKSLKLVLGFAAAFFCSLLIGSVVFAADYTVVEVDSVSDLQDALDEAAENATSSNPYKIIMKEGSYTISDSINIYSNTYLEITGVTFKLASGNANNMLKVGDKDDTTATGYYYKNITINGGTLNANGNGNTVIKIAHASNVTLTNVTVKNVSDGHLMEVAGVNGLYISDCTFADQSLTAGDDETQLTYEAIQLDILTSDHFSGYLSEDLAIKNVEITGCTFDNVPRGIGSHTAILNNPIDGLVIENNTFSDISSCAIQLMGVKNCTISNNTLTSVPRGIYIYSYQWDGTYLGSVLKKEDSVGSATSSTYSTPSSSGIVISSNTITVSGSDSYAEYESAAIWVQGFDLESSTSVNGGTIPKGNYYLTGVTISKNTITTISQGIRLADVYSSTVSSNKVTGNSTEPYYGISTCLESKKNVITGNTVDKFYRGIYVYDGSTASDISSNTISGITNSAIMIQESTVTTVTSNTISSPGVNGVYVYSGSKVSKVKSNEITSPGKYGIDVEGSTVTYIKSNTVSGSSNNGIYVYSGSTVTYVLSNSVSSAGKYGIDVEGSTVKYIKSNTVSKPSKNGIYVYDGSTVTYIQSNTVTSAGKYGIDVEGSTAKYIKSNKVSKSSGNGIYVCGSSTVTYVKSNTVASAGKYGISVEKSTASYIQKNTITSASSHGIMVSSSGKVKEISSNKIKNGSGRGISIISLKCNLVIKSNTVSKCGSDYLIYLNPSTTKYTITVKSNALTGKSKKQTGVRADSGKIVLQSNTIKSCNYASQFKTAVVGTIYKNTLSGNKYNKYQIGSTKVGNLSTPTLKTSATSKSSIKASWSKVSGTGYQLYRATSKSGTYKKVKSISSSSTVSYKNTGLKKSKTYYYKVRAYKKVGNTTIYSSFSTVKSAKTKSS